MSLKIIGPAAFWKQSDGTWFAVIASDERKLRSIAKKQGVPCKRSGIKRAALAEPGARNFAFSNGDIAK